MLENFNKPINPHNNSIIPDKLNLTLKNKEHKQGELQDKETGDIYFKKQYHGGIRELHLREHFISLLIKGILHSADMVRVGDNNFFSRKINLENTEKGLPLEKEAEIFILKNILGDFDRDIDNSNHNIEQNDNGQFYHYDFEAGFRSDEFEQIHKKSKNAYKIYNDFCEEKKFLDEDIYNFSLQVLNKLNTLEQAVNDKNFISAILKKTGFQPSSELDRIDNTNKTIKKMKDYFNKKETNKDIEDLNFIRVKKLLLKPIKAMKNVAEKEIKSHKIKSSRAST